MKMEITVTEAVELINQIRHHPDCLFEMIRATVKENVGQYLAELMQTELSHFLGRGRYQRTRRRASSHAASERVREPLSGIFLESCSDMASLW